MKKTLLLFLVLSATAYAQDISDWNTEEYFENATVESVRQYLKAGADPQAKGKFGYTPLHIAEISNTNPEIIAVLLNAGADPLTSDWNTAEYFKSATVESLRQYLKAGADPQARDKDGSTPLHFAAMNNQNPEVISTLLKAGANLQAKDKFGSTLLHFAAAANKNPEVIKLLLKAGADPQAKDKFGYTSLHMAAANNENPEVIKLLLKAGANLQAKDKFGTTPLHYAAQANKNPEVITTLLKAGADPQARTKDGKIAWDIIQENEALKNTEAYRQLSELR